jgi:alcohol dehydrogenase (cytochrome c)
MRLLKQALASTTNPILLGTSLALLVSTCGAWAQGVTNQELLNPPSTTWPLYHGDYSGERHTHLTQITPENVGYLSLAWVFRKSTHKG